MVYFGFIEFNDCDILNQLKTRSFTEVFVSKHCPRSCDVNSFFIVFYAHEVFPWGLMSAWCFSIVISLSLSLTHRGVWMLLWGFQAPVQEAC